MNKIEIEQKRDSFIKFLDRDPNNTSIITQLIEFDLQLGDFDSVLSRIDNLFAKGIKSEHLLFQKSNALLAKGESFQALELLDSHEFSESAQIPVQINKCHANFQLGNFDAVDTILSSLNSYPEPSVYILHARSLHHLGKIDTAIKILEKSLSEYPDNKDIKGLLSLLMLDEGIYEAETLKYAEEALAGNPNQLEGLLTAGMLNQQYLKDLTAAEKYFDRAIDSHPAVGRGWLYKGLSVMMRKEIKEAQVYLTKACELMPEHIGSWHSLAWCQLLQNNIVGARNSFEKALIIDRNFAETHGGISIVEAMEGDFDKARKTAKLALKLNPQSFSAQYTQIILAEADNDPEKVKNTLETVFDTEQGKEALDFIKILQNT